MKILELFSGTECLSNAFRARGHECFTVDWDEKFPSNLHIDIEQLTSNMILKLFGKPDVVWIGTDCVSYSIAGISHHRRKNPETGDLEPISDYAKKCDRMNLHVLTLIKELKPTLWYIENPRASLRKMSFMKELPRYTICYCQYEDDRMKPTDLWTNHPNPSFKPMCKNGAKCHVAAPRGSATPGSTQGRKGSMERSMYPHLLTEHIVDISEDYILNNNVAVECRDCKNITKTCDCTEKCDDYKCRYNLDLRMNINDAVIMYS